MNTKPLSEWTLAEVKAECKKHDRGCNSCMFYSTVGHCRISQNGDFSDCPFSDCPEAWDLSEPPRWTEQDKEDAKALRRLIPDAYILFRYSANTVLKLYDRDENFIMNLNDCFPVLPLGKKITLDEIIGGAK